MTIAENENIRGKNEVLGRRLQALVISVWLGKYLKMKTSWCVRVENDMEYDLNRYDKKKMLIVQSEITGSAVSRIEWL